MWKFHVFKMNRVVGAMFSVHASSVVDRKCKPPFGTTKDYEIGMCCFSPKQEALGRKSKDWFVSKWSDMYIRGLWIQWAITKKCN